MRRGRAGQVVAAVVVTAAVVVDVVLQGVLAAPDAPTVEHEWPAEASGQVWVVVDPPDEGSRRVELEWGPWRQRASVEAGEAVAFSLTKAATSATESVAIRVTVDPGGAVSFGVGPTPAGLPVVDLDGGWHDTGPLP